MHITHCTALFFPVFGMNLSNGWCGPEGCLTLSTQDSGRFGFFIVVSSTVFMGLIGTALFYFYAEGDGDSTSHGTEFEMKHLRDPNSLEAREASKKKMLFRGGRVLLALAMLAAVVSVLLTKNLQSLREFVSGGGALGSAGGTP
jgi:hypothetical protein